MADTKISALTEGVTARPTDRIPVARSPYGSGDNAYLEVRYFNGQIIALSTFQALAFQ